MSTHDHAKALQSLLKSIKSKYQTPEIPERDALDEMIYSFLLWEATSAKADAAFKRILSSVVDHNELRVCKPQEMVAMIGKTYPRAEERAQRLKASLHELFLREFAVSLEKCAALPKRDARRYLDTLEGMLPYVSARVVLVRLGGHAVPVDDKLLSRLIDEEVMESGTDAVKAEGILDRHVKADDALRTHLLLQAWCDDPSSEPKKASKPKKAESKPAAGATPTATTKGTGARKSSPKSRS